MCRMIVVLFAVVGLAMGLCILYRILYGIIVLVFNPQKSSLTKLVKMSSYLLIAIVIYVVCVLLINSFFAHTNLYYLQFTFGDIFYLISQRLQRRF
ncbi:MAG: hypothetical protein LBH96_04055 [Candidatus Peribacteria bacterium]|nr:hypothetical protein [Candidatus Peribacteria bacterium]